MTKNCKPEFSHIDRDEFGNKRKITSSLLLRFCQNIRALYNKTKTLEDSTDPELRKRFHPLLIDEQKSYGTTLDSKNQYKFDNTTNTTFIDTIGEYPIPLNNFTKTPDTENLYQKNLEYVEGIAQIIETDTKITYTLQSNIENVKNTESSYYIDKYTKTVYIHTSDDQHPLYHTINTIIHSKDIYINEELTTCHIDLENHTITIPYETITQYDEEELDQNTATELINGKEVLKPLNTFWYMGWLHSKPFWMSPEWLNDPFSENPHTPDEPTLCRSFTFTPEKTGLLKKVQIRLTSNPQAEDEFYCEIRTTTSDGYPSQQILAREKTYLRQFHQSSLFPIPFHNPPLLTKGVKYAIVLRAGFTSYSHTYGIGGWQNPCPGGVYPHGDLFISQNNGRTWIKNDYYPDISFREGLVRPKKYAWQTYMQTTNSQLQPREGKFQVCWKPIRCNPIKNIQLIPSFQNNGGTVEWFISSNNRDWHPIKAPDWYYDFETGPLAEQNQQTLYIMATLTSGAGILKTPIINGLKANIHTKPALQAYIRTIFYNPRLTNPLGASIWSGIGTNIKIDPPTEKDIQINIEIIRNTITREYINIKKDQKTIKLQEHPAQPLIMMLFYTKSAFSPTLQEGYHYIVDYDTKTITFPEPPIFDGIIQVDYYPLWLKNLKPEDFPIKTDLFTEYYTGTGELDLFKLKTTPIDPIRTFEYYNTQEDEWTELIEDIDFKVDYFQKTIKNLKPTIKPPENMEYNYRIKYTPYLADTGLALAYHLQRKNTNQQIHIQGNYYQNRV
jgi:hypothetical protein